MFMLLKLLVMLLQLFNEGNYKTASFCFKRAGNVYRSKWAKAASLQMDGESNLHSDFETASNRLSKAAEIYDEIDKQDLAAACFMKWKNYTKAGMRSIRMHLLSVSISLVVCHLCI